MSRKPSKYRNIRTVVDGIRFDSKKEALRYSGLKLMERAGAISNLELQPSLDLIVNGMKCGFYKADFSYLDVRTGEAILEDVKGFKTPIYRLKKKLVKAIHGIEIFET